MKRKPIIKPNEPHLQHAFDTLMNHYVTTHDVFDADEHGLDEKHYAELERRYLVRFLGSNLWRPTLAGVAFAYSGIPPTRTYKRPTVAEQILAYIQQNPGIPLSEAVQATTASYGGARYAAKELEKAGRIRRESVALEGQPHHLLYPT